MRKKSTSLLITIAFLSSGAIAATHPTAHPHVTAPAHVTHEQSAHVENQAKETHEPSTSVNQAKAIQKQPVNINSNQKIKKVTPQINKVNEINAKQSSAKTENEAKSTTKSPIKATKTQVDTHSVPKIETAPPAATEKPLKPSKDAAVASVKKFFTDRSKGNVMNGYQAINSSNDPQVKGQQAAMVAALVVQTNNKMTSDSTLNPKDIKFNQAELEKKFADKKSAFYIAYVNALNKINQVKNLPPDQELFGPNHFDKNTKIIQGSEGDCYFLSAINGVLHTKEGPQNIRKMIAKVSGETNVFKVTFPNGQHATVTLTDAEIGMYSHVEKGGKWLAILSVAEAKMLSSEDALNPYKKRLDPEAMMNGGYPAQTLNLLTGQKFSTTTLSTGKPTAAEASNVIKMISSAEKQNLPITISTNDHVLTILGCKNCAINTTNGTTTITGTVLIKNPWGSNGVYYNPKSGDWTADKNANSKNGPQYLMNDNGEFEVPLNNIADGFHYITSPT